MDWHTELPASASYGIIAIAGGVARYLRGFVDGKKFKLTVFVASGFVAGFSGLMFAFFGIEMGVHQTTIYIMSGVGGFFGEQTMKLILEHFEKI